MAVFCFVGVVIVVVSVVVVVGGGGSCVYCFILLNYATLTVIVMVHIYMLAVVGVFIYLAVLLLDVLCIV